MLPVWFRPLTLSILLLGWGAVAFALVSMIVTRRRARLEAAARPPQASIQEESEQKSPHQS